MAEESYLRWLENNSPTHWWHDSGDPEELCRGVEHRATGVTTNPVLISKTLRFCPDKWAVLLKGLKKDLPPNQRAELLVGGVVKNAARMFLGEYESSGGRNGYVCAQVSPALASDRAGMFEMSKRFHRWAPNIAVKLPVTAAGLDTLEECIAEGMTITATISFTVPQVIAVAERHRKGVERAKRARREPGKCFVVIMIGRIDDYLRDVAMDRKADVMESDIRQAGIAITKRAYRICEQQGYDVRLLIAALRGTYHMEALRGGRLTMSIHPKYQDMLLKLGVPKIHDQIDVTVDQKVIRRLQTIPDFVRAYEPDGMKAEDFITFGVTQRTLTQFDVAGWSQIESFVVQP